MKYIYAALVATLMFAETSFAETINVPGDYATIQGAINASSNGDVINIAAGTYNEYNLNPGGKAITIGSASGNLNVTIDAQQGGSAFVINSGEGSGTVIRDLIITGGQSTYGGGIYCKNQSKPTISGCTISGNAADVGGGIYCDGNSNPTIMNCTISNNTASQVGGGIYCWSSSPTISGCEISNNTAEKTIGNGGGIYCMFNSNPTISDCTISGNTAPYGGGGIYCNQNSSPVHSGCTFSDNTPDNVYGDSDWNPLRGEGGPSIITLENCTICGTGEHVSGLIVHVGENHISDCIDDCPATCNGDLNTDGAVDVNDLLALLALWGACP